MNAKKDRMPGILRHLTLFLLDAVLVLILWTYADANLHHYTAKMDADIASETLLGTRIYENGFRQPDTWVVSTHNYVIMAPNLAAFIYPIVGKNMNLAMGIAIVLLFLLMARLMYVYLCNMELSHIGVVCAMILSFSLMGTSDDIQQMIFLYAAYYVVHFITLFLFLILYNKAIDKDKIPSWIFGLTLLLSFLNGLQGMHAALFCYMPLLGVEIVRRFVSFIKKEKQSSFLILGWLLATSFLSVFATKIVGSYTLGASRNIRHAGEKFIEYVWPFFLDVISFEKMPVLVTLFCILAALGYIYTVKELLTGKGECVVAEDAEKAAVVGTANSPFWSVLAFPFGVIVCMLSSTFTTAEAAPRYYIMILFVVGVGVALFMRGVTELAARSAKGEFASDAKAATEDDARAVPMRSAADAKNGKAWAKYVCAAIAALVIIYGLDKAYVFNKDLIINDDSFEQATTQIARWMEDNGYEYGYSTFNQANTITVMSNNKVKVRAVNSMKEMQGAKWLSDKTWYPPIKDADGPTCYIVTEANAEEFAEFMDDRKPAVIEQTEIDDYTVYVLDHDYTVWVD